MGLIASIYRDGINCSNGGLSSWAKAVTVVNADGPFEPDSDRPAVVIVAGSYPGIARVVEAEWFEGGPNGGEWAEARKPEMVGPMMGGCYVATSDSRFVELVEAVTGSRFYGAVPLHDRYETAEQYASYD